MNATRAAHRRFKRLKVKGPVTGRCFEVAMEVADQIGPPAVIVHGLPIGTGQENQGARYWHAWVEFNGLAITVGSGKLVGLPLMTYYSAGDIQSTWRFDRDQARSEILSRGHAGPWVDDWEGMGL